MRRYRLLDVTFTFYYATRAELEAIHPALAHLEIGAPARDEVSVVVRERDGRHDVASDGVTVSEGRRLDEIAPLAKALLRQELVNRTRHFMEIHAAVLARGGRCLLLPAAPGSGKSTLAAALAAAGWEYFSDEVALLEPGTLAVRPVPVALTVKPGAVDVLARWYPEVRDLPLHRRADDQRVRYLAPGARGRAALSAQSLPVGWIVFPRYAPERATALEPIERAAALEALLRECQVLPERLDRAQVRRLVEWMRGVACRRLWVASADEAVACLDGLCFPAEAGGT